MSRPTLGVTPSQTVGPFFHYALPYDTGPRLVAPDAPGAIRLHGVVLDGDGAPIPDALLEIWHADTDGKFSEQPGIYDEPAGFRGFGRCPTDADGVYEFVTIKPGAVPTVEGTAQAPHIAMSVFARGALRQMATRIYFDDEAEANATDPLLQQLAAERAATLVARRSDRGYRFDVRVQGEQETVFLDVFGR